MDPSVFRCSAGTLSTGCLNARKGEVSDCRPFENSQPAPALFGARTHSLSIPRASSRVGALPCAAQLKSKRRPRGVAGGGDEF